MASWGAGTREHSNLAMYLDGHKGCMLWSKGMYREHVRRMLSHLKRALRMEHRLTVEEFYQLLQLSEAIIAYGRMIQTDCGYSVPYVIVEVPELAHRFRETPRTIKDALLLLSDMGRAESAHLYGCWKLQLASTLLSGREGSRSATHHPHSLEDHNRDAGSLSMRVKQRSGR